MASIRITEYSDGVVRPSDSSQFAKAIFRHCSEGRDTVTVEEFEWVKVLLMAHDVAVHVTKTEDRFHPLMPPTITRSTNDEKPLGEYLVQNAIRTPDGTLIRSVHSNDYRTHVDRNGVTYGVDGGLVGTMRRRGPSTGEFAYTVENKTWDGTTHEERAHMLHWGSQGRWIPVRELGDLHIREIVKLPYFNNIHLPLRQCILDEIDYRRDLANGKK